MQTRSKLNLKNKSIHSLLLDNSTNRKTNKEPKRLKKTKTNAKKRKTLPKRESKVKRKSVKKVEPLFLILDTESFSLKDNHLPIQISWQLFKGKNLEAVSPQKMYYVAEMWLLSEYRDLVQKARYFTKNTKQKHENHMKNSDFPIVGASKIIDELKEDLEKCDYFCAFNLEWDKESLENLIESLDIYDEEFNLFGDVKFLDIMYFVYAVFSEKLIEKGVEDKIINESGRKIDYHKKGIYCASYMLDVLSDGQQEQYHLADKDVDSEHYLLAKALEKGFHKLKRQIDTSIPLYEMVQEKASEMYKDILYVLMRLDQNDLCYKCNILLEKNTLALRHKYITDRFICDNCDHS